MNISFTKRFTACLRNASDAELQAVERACRLAGEVFGHPHRHTGVGLRRLGRTHFECRVGVNLRLVFLRERDRLVFDFAGNHDQVQGYLKVAGAFKLSLTSGHTS